MNSSLIGVLSDSHGHADRVREAARLFAERGVRRLFHCGDIGGGAVIDELAAFSTLYVAGNVDWDLPALQEHVRGPHSHLRDRWAEADLNGKRLALTHGHEDATLNWLIGCGQYDWVFHGHTHQFRDERFGRTRVVCPGALHGVRTHSVVVIRLEDDRVERIILP